MSETKKKTEKVVKTKPVTAKAKPVATKTKAVAAKPKAKTVTKTKVLAPVALTSVSNTSLILSMRQALTTI